VQPLIIYFKVIKDYDEAIARWVSHVISPHIVGVVVFSILTLTYSDKPFEVLLWVAFIVPFLVIPPLVYLLWLVRQGAIEDIYMPNRATRVRPLTVMMGWFFVCLGLIHYWEAPPLVEVLILLISMLVGVLSLVTLFWKISFHGATITAAATTTVMVSSSYYVWPVMLLVPLVGWSRIRLKRHTPVRLSTVRWWEP
jgi:hypothetical protein